MEHVRPMIAFLDVAYTDTVARSACVLAEAWTDEAPADELVTEVDGVLPYQPGNFYLRELPPLLQVLSRVPLPLDVIVVDGYVWVDDKPGLGARLRAALVGSPHGHAAVVGAAKTRWHSGAGAPLRGEQRVVGVWRGKSVKPLYVTAVGVDVEVAAGWIRGMYGKSRLPTLLRWVDRLSRGGRTSG